MQEPPLLMVQTLSELDDQLAAELIALLRTLSDALEQHYAAALARRQQCEWESRQPSLWPEEDPPF